MESSWDILRSQLEDLIAEKLSRVSKELHEHRDILTRLAEQVNKVSEAANLGADPIYLKPPKVELSIKKPVLDISYDRSSEEYNGSVEEIITSHESLEEKIAIDESSLLESSNPFESTQRSDDLTADLTTEEIEISMDSISSKITTDESKIKKSDEIKTKKHEEEKKKPTEEEKKKKLEESKKKKAEELEEAKKTKAAEEAKKKKTEEETKKKKAEEAENKKKALEEAKKKKAEEEAEKKKSAEETKKRKAEEEAEKKKAAEEAKKKKKKAAEEAKKKKKDEEPKPVEEAKKKKKADEEIKPAEEAKKKKEEPKKKKEEESKKKKEEEAKKKKADEELKKKKTEEKKEEPKRKKTEEESKKKKQQETKAKKPELTKQKTEKLEESTISLVDVHHIEETIPSSSSETESLGQESPILSEDEELTQLNDELEHFEDEDQSFPTFELPTSTEFQLMNLNDLGLNIATKPGHKTLWVLSLLVQLLGQDASDSDQVWEKSQEILKKAKEQGYEIAIRETIHDFDKTLHNLEKVDKLIKGRKHLLSPDVHSNPLGSRLVLVVRDVLQFSGVLKGGPAQYRKEWLGHKKSSIESH